MRKKLIVLLLITSFNVALGQRSLIPQEIVVNTDEALNTLFLPFMSIFTNIIKFFLTIMYILWYHLSCDDWKRCLFSIL